MLDTVFVCDHALDRWCERAASHMMSTKYDVIAALKEAKKVLKDGFLPIPKEKNKVYFHHDKLNIFFVVEPIDFTSCRIITIISNEVLEPKPILNPKKRTKPKTKWEILIERNQEIQKQMTILKLKRIYNYKKSPQRNALLLELKDIEQKMKDLKTKEGKI